VIIGVDIREWQPGRHTGIGRFLEEFLRAASAARPSDRFLLIGNATCEIRVQAGNIDVLRIPERWTLWWDQVTLARALCRNGVDVFYSPYIKMPLFATVPVVSTLHDLTFIVLEEYNRAPVDRIVHSLLRALCWLVVRRAAVLLVDSETSARDVRRLLGADRTRLCVIPLATSPRFRSNGDRRDDADVWERYGLGDSYVLYVGGFSLHKNVPTLIRAHRALPASLRVRHPLVLVGGPVPPAIQTLAQNPDGSDGARCLGVVPDADLPALYRGAALFACPSRYEGFGLPVLEAMSCGVPVLCSTAPALLELGAGAALHVDSKDEGAWESALMSLLEDSGRREKLAAAGLARAAAYTPDRMTKEILMALDEAVACSP